mgnify:FL=1
MSNEVRFLSYRAQAVLALARWRRETGDLERIASTGKAPGSLKRELKRLRVWLEATDVRMRAVPITRGEKAQAIADKNARKRRN